jgi:hypothetical protein
MSAMLHIVKMTVLLLLSSSLYGQIISQYIETSSGSIPKGVEIWNNTLNELDFTKNNLIIEKGTNGASPTNDYILSSGSLLSGEVIVIGTSDMQSIVEANGSVFYLKAFTFNGDDALVVKYGTDITDVFGLPGNDPGIAWKGNGVSTANQNISLKESIQTGDTDGWNDPSERFLTVSTDNSLAGFGIAPVLITGILTVDTIFLSNFFYTFQRGPSASQFFKVCGSSLSNDIIITPPSDFEISIDNLSFSNSPIILVATAGTLPSTPIYVRLISDLEIGGYLNEPITISSIGSVSVAITCNGRVKYTDNMDLPNAWINEFHYDNEGVDQNEFIEIVIENSTLFNLSNFKVTLYNGGNGTEYDSMRVDSFKSGFNTQGYSFYTWHPASIQNGSPDGISIDYKGEPISFISYEGNFTATDGPAFGVASSDIGIAESSTKTLAGYSLQLIGTGTRYSEFQWIDPPATPGIKNDLQFFGSTLTPVPLDYSVTIVVFLLVGFSLIFKFCRRKSSHA